MQQMPWVAPNLESGRNHQIQVFHSEVHVHESSQILYPYETSLYCPIPLCLEPLYRLAHYHQRCVHPVRYLPDKSSLPNEEQIERGLQNLLCADYVWAGPCRTILKPFF